MAVAAWDAPPGLAEALEEARLLTVGPGGVVPISALARPVAGFAQSVLAHYYQVRILRDDQGYRDPPQAWTVYLLSIAGKPRLAPAMPPSCVYDALPAAAWRRRSALK